ncbi:hypothetical protein D3C72_1491890 [compost metagenome]
MTDRVERAGTARRRLDAAARQPQAGQPQRDIDEKDAAPAELVDQDAPQQGAGRARDRHDRRPCGQHAVAHLFVVIGVGEQAERAGHEQRGAHALQHAGGDQGIRVRSQAAQQGRHREHAQAGQIEGFAAIAVGQRAGHQQQGGEGERVAVHDPDQVRQRHGELDGDAGQRHVDDGDIQHGHHESDGQGDQRQPAGNGGLGIQRGSRGLVAGGTHGGDFQGGL